MKHLLLTYWYLFLAGFLLGIVMTILIQKIREVSEDVFRKASLIKRYWTFTIPFFVLASILYVLVFRFSPELKLQINIEILGQMLTLIFAIFIGYFAFLQVVESRFEKLKEQGYRSLKQKSYRRAREYYEQAHLINPKDFSVLSDLTELYLIIQDNVGFQNKIRLLERTVIETREKIVLFYLRTTRFLLLQDLGNAKSELNELLKFLKESPEFLTHFSWNFDDIRACPSYKNLKGDPKLILDNLIAYLQKQLQDAQKRAFENGDVSLRETVVSPTLSQ